MKRRELKPLTKAELRIMEVLWARGAGTVADVLANLSEQFAYTTVLTMLRILEQKGAVSRRDEGRGHVYSPVLKRDEAARSAVGDVVAAFFANSRTALALKLMAEAPLSAADIERVKEIIRRHEQAK